MKSIFIVLLAIIPTVACVGVSYYLDGDTPILEEDSISNEPIPTSIKQSAVEPTAPFIDLSIQPIPENAHPAFQVFDKFIDIFGVHIYASQQVPDIKAIHAATVMAEYLDNDEDGQPDNPAVLAMLRDNQAALIMFGREGDPAERRFEDKAEDLFDRGVALQNLYAFETIPNGASRGEFDATLEEVLHLITHAGYAYAYPDIWGEIPGTAVAEAMDVARGGHFEDVPRSYPQDAWYSYDDRTCDYGCMVTEYIYWALTSILGAQDFPGRFEEIEHEWKLNTRKKVLQTDPSIYDLLLDPTYKFPSELPDGNYNP